jgi:hypothetical protein
MNELYWVIVKGPQEVALDAITAKVHIPVLVYSTNLLDRETQFLIGPAGEPDQRTLLDNLQEWVHERSWADNAGYKAGSLLVFTKVKPQYVGSYHDSYWLQADCA